MTTPLLPRVAQPGPGVSHVDTDRPIECIITHHPHMPRDRGGHATSVSGRYLLRQAAELMLGTDPAHCPVVDPSRRWYWPGINLHGSVSHVPGWSLTTLSTGGHIGADIQDFRERPGAMAFIGDLVKLSRSASLREFAECEAVVKVSELTKETFGHVRLPEWTPGWRHVFEDYWVWSLEMHGMGVIALASDLPRAIRWWRCDADARGRLQALRPISSLGPGRPS